MLFGPVITARLERQWPIKAEEQQDYYARTDTASLYFAPDYDLSPPGPGNIATGNAIYLLFLCRKPELKNSNARSAKTRVFSLVLRRVDEGQGGSSSQYRLEGDVVEVPGDSTYKRIGIYIDALESTNSKRYIEENGVECIVKLI